MEKTGRTFSRPSFFSFELRGLHRTTTRTVSSLRGISSTAKGGDEATLCRLPRCSPRCACPAVRASWAERRCVSRMSADECCRATWCNVCLGTSLGSVTSIETNRESWYMRSSSL
eukprot:4702562-Pleurochrysis_carterae.AAC.3